MATLNPVVNNLLSQPGAKMVPGERVIAIPGPRILSTQTQKTTSTLPRTDLRMEVILAQREMQAQLRRHAQLVSSEFETRIARSANNYSQLQTWAKVQSTPGQTVFTPETMLDRKVGQPASNAATVAIRDMAASPDTIPASSLSLMRKVEYPFYQN